MAERLSPADGLQCPAGWDLTPKQYCADLPARDCFVENDATVAGSPLWPEDPSFDSSRIEKNLHKIRTALAKRGGMALWGHVPLDSQRRVPQGRAFLLSPTPQRLASTFVSGVLLPKAAMTTTHMGFLPTQGTMPPLSHVTKKLPGTWLLSNLGYFVTPRLIEGPETGGFPFAHNARHPAAEHLRRDDIAYLGGFVVRDSGSSAQFPPLFATGAAGVRRSGALTLIDDVAVRGGTITIGDAALAWSAQDVNPSVADDRPVILYTPSFTTDATRAATQSGAWESYRSFVGEDRINLILANIGTGEHPQPRIAYAVDGACLQPATAHVISIARAHFKARWPSPALNWRLMPVMMECEPWCDTATWNDCTTMYEGLMPLHQPDFLRAWQHPHAIMAQETFLPNPLRREPRIALVETEQHVGVICCSGRYEWSIGISLQEQWPLLQSCVAAYLPGEPLLRALGLDGGSGAKLCLVQDGVPHALNWVAPGRRNKFGALADNTYSYCAMQLA